MFNRYKTKEQKAKEKRQEMLGKKSLEADATWERIGEGVCISCTQKKMVGNAIDLWKKNVSGEYLQWSNVCLDCFMDRCDKGKFKGPNDKSFRRKVEPR